MDLPDPRVWPAAAGAPPQARRLYGLATASLEAATGREADAADAAIADALRTMLAEPEAGLAALFDDAPSSPVYRHLWRVLAAAIEDDPSPIRLFAIPVVIVAHAAGTPVVVPGVLSDAGTLADVLRDHGALGGNRTLALAPVLASAESIDLAALPVLLAASRSETIGQAPLALPAAPLEATAVEGAHLRFVVGALAAARLDTGEGWGRPFAEALARQIGAAGVSLLALPRPAASLLAAVARGRAAQREVALQLFASSALRELRASFGEPVAVLSAHLAPDAPGGGELRLSLSSQLSPHDARGFRCPLYLVDRVAEVAAFVIDLLRDCRVADIRSMPGVHPDRDAVTGGPLLFKPSGADGLIPG